MTKLQAAETYEQALIAYENDPSLYPQTLQAWRDYS